MSSRLKLIVAYDGGSFAGWQSQAVGNTIQDRIEDAFHRICGARLRVHGAGRTDAGVHAIAQCAHVDLPDSRLTAERWLAALNGILPSAIRITRCGYVPETFHARFSAKGKIYRYRIWNAPVLPPFENGRAWHIAHPLDLEEMTAATRQFCGKHDFAAFSAHRGKLPKTTVRTIHAVRLRRSGKYLSIDFEGDGFLYKMVRMMVGALVKIGLKKSRAHEIAARLKLPQKVARGPRLVAPAQGLFLVRVRY